MIHCHLNWWLKFLSRKCEKTINDFHWLGLAPICEIKLVFLLEIRWKPREQITESRIRTKPIISSVELCWVWHPSVKYNCFSSLEIRWKPRELDCSHSLYFRTRQKRDGSEREARAGAYPVKSSFCAGFQFSHDSASAFNHRIKLRENEGLWTVYTRTDYGLENSNEAACDHIFS